MRGGDTSARTARASRVAAAWGGAVPFVVAEPEDCGGSLLDAVEMRRAGTRFVACLLLDDDRVRAAEVLAHQVLGQIAQPDARRQAMDLLAREALTVNGGPQTALRFATPAGVSTLRDIAMLGDVVAVRSQRERIRLEASFAPFGRGLVRRWVVACGGDPRVPPLPGAVGGDARDAILVWAPDQPAADLALTLFALAERRGPVYVVCAGGEPAAVANARAIEPADVAAVAASIGVVVCADPYDPSSALAFAATGVPIAAPRTSGADEWVDGVCCYDPWDHLSLADAVADAAAAAPTRTLRAPGAEPLRTALAAHAPTTVVDPPLVSLILPTYERRGLLPIVLRALQRQTYPRLEIVLVNDGAPVDDLLVDYPAVRNLRRDGPRGLNAAYTFGMTHARGTYLGIQPDDDPPFPEHVARLVGALERTKAVLAYARPLAAIHEPNAGGGYDLAGFRLVGEHPIDPFSFAASNTIANTALFRRDAFERAGNGYRDEVGYLSDFDLWLRLLRQGDFVHVPDVTTELIWRTDETNTSLQRAALNAGLYERLYGLHPVDGRPLVDDLRRRQIESMRDPESFRMPLPALRIDDPRCRDVLPPVRGRSAAPAAEGAPPGGD